MKISLVNKISNPLLSDSNSTIFYNDFFINNSKSAEFYIKVSIIIPVYNKVEYTTKCLASIIENTPSNDYEIIIIDNASTDGTLNYLKKKINAVNKKITVICNKDNLGFAKANNQGAKLAQGEYLLLLNNDTEVLTGWLDPLVQILERDDSVGAVGAKLLFPDGPIQHAGVIIIGRNDSQALIARHVFQNMKKPPAEAGQCITFQAVTAACMLLKKTIFNEVSGFDESYWNGSEDVDLCFKIQSLGKMIVYQPQSTVIHHESKSGKERFVAIPKNNARLSEKWSKKINPDLIIEDSGFLTGNCEKIKFYNRAFDSISGLDRSPSENIIRWVRTNNLHIPGFSLKNITRIAIKICTPFRDAKGWGDTYFAECMAEAFRSLNCYCVVQYADEWESREAKEDIVIHLRGVERYFPKPGQYNILWIISHPEFLIKDEIESYDLVLCGSYPYYQYLKSTVSIPCFYLPQATDIQIFDKPVLQDIDILFIGNNYYKNKPRQIIYDLFATGKQYDLHVIGQGWKRIIDDKYIKGEYVDWQSLPKIYSRAKIVLNDHHKTMKFFGFINNRTYDLAMLNVFQISDEVPGMKELGITTYRTPDELREKLDYYLANDQERNEICKKVFDICKDHTFDMRASQVLDLLNTNHFQEIRKRPSGKSMVGENATFGFQVPVDKAERDKIFLFCTARKELIESVISKYEEINPGVQFVFYLKANTDSFLHKREKRNFKISLYESSKIWPSLKLLKQVWNSGCGKVTAIYVDEYGDNYLRIDFLLLLILFLKKRVCVVNNKLEEIDFSLKLFYKKHFFPLESLFFLLLLPFSFTLDLLLFCFHRPKKKKLLFIMNGSALSPLLMSQPYPFFKNIIAFEDKILISSEAPLKFNKVHMNSLKRQLEQDSIHLIPFQQMEHFPGLLRDLIILTKIVWKYGVTHFYYRNCNYSLIQKYLKFFGVKEYVFNPEDFTLAQLIRKYSQGSGK